MEKNKTRQNTQQNQDPIVTHGKTVFPNKRLCTVQLSLQKLPDWKRRLDQGKRENTTRERSSTPHKRPHNQPMDVYPKNRAHALKREPRRLAETRETVVHKA